MYAHHPAQRLGRGRDRGGGFDRRALQAGERPRIAECPLSLECRCLWERELEPGDRNVVLCLKVVNVAMDPALYEGGRYGPKGYLYNIRSRGNPETGERKPAMLGVLTELGTYDEIQVE
ncbi:hypothetical protein D7X94_01750 [Acutalibacter sp. 1XD8-33]|uniref:hypothetical protein n=1 Tax=Acutalibacter sp. 1XD8-33 TaxID=2320081 RepID=UPI000EA34476|nr:hypothetical protein [Acutalibacter sp. 1XD8-33]RKJ42223.1 hypothetical protein D7X94_01750 [Acutalibacter sp. 1XD8-33]